MMQLIDWSTLDENERATALARPALADSAGRREAVADIIASVRKHGDAAVRDHTRRLDKVDIESLAVPAADIEIAGDELDPATREAIDQAFKTIEAFHKPSGRQSYEVDTAPGVRCRRLVRPLATVGLYAPGGSAVLPSTVLMLGVPALLAGCDTRVLCTPPRNDGSVAPAIRYTAHRCGIDLIIRAGGAQAIAAMAYGAESVPKVDKLFGPGNGWVTEAKKQAADDPAGALSDMPAGPSELLVIADDRADPTFVAADLLSQAEHGPDSQVLLVTASKTLAHAVGNEIPRQLETLPRKTTAQKALTGSRIILVKDDTAAVEIANRYAPEHLILSVADPESLLPSVRNAGSVFLGPWTPESLGDYASGTNHVLPTYGYARQFGGLSVSDFQKSLSVQTATAEGLNHIGPATVVLAREEGLEAHARAVTLRLAALEEQHACA